MCQDEEVEFYSDLIYLHSCEVSSLLLSSDTPWKVWGASTMCKRIFLTSAMVTESSLLSQPGRHLPQMRHVRGTTLTGCPEECEQVSQHAAINAVCTVGALRGRD